MATKEPVDLTVILLWPTAYNKPWARKVGRSSPVSPVFPGIHYVLLLLKGTFLTWRYRNTLISECLLYEEK
jgi:hypothetical protein